MKLFIYSYGVPTEKYPINGIFAFDHAKAMENIGIDVLFLVLDLRSFRRTRKFFFSERIIDGIKVLELSVPIGGIFNVLLDFIDRILFQILYNLAIHKYGKPDVIHSHFLRQSRSIALTIPTEVNFFSTIHDSHLVKYISRRDIDSLRRIEGKARCIFTVSKVLNSKLNELNISSVVLNNIVDESVFNYKEKYKTYPLQILSAAQLTKRKGMDLLLLAWSLFGQRDHYILKIMGEGSELQNLKELVVILNIESSVIFTGKYNRIDFANELHKSILFVMASRLESFGLVYAEALQTGTPIVATKCGGPEDIVSSRNGILVDINSSKIKDGIQMVLNRIDSYDNEDISNNIRLNFGSVVIAQKLKKIYLDN